MITSRLLLVPRYPEINPMGFVGESTYPRWFDLGRAALLKDHGLDYRQLEALGYWVPVLEIGLTFHRPAFFAETLELFTTLRARPTFRIRLDYEVRREGVLLTAGHSVQGFVNRLRRPVRPPPEFLARLEAVFPRAAPGAAQNSTAGP